MNYETSQEERRLDRALGEALDKVRALNTDLAALEIENRRMAEALEWYAEQVKGCRYIGHPGDPYRHALDKDAGDKARAALRKEKPNAK